jgi:P-type Ca2+ transporter type 2C
LFPRWHAFLRQYNDSMQIGLLAAGIGSLYPLKQLGTGILLILLTLFNTVEGLHQEGKATAAVSALQKMMIITARVRRDGQLTEIPAGQLVPRDIVALDAGDIVPADGRLLTAATLEVDESALTGESLPTIVKAVELGRGLYDNLARYVRFQIGGLFGYIITFLSAPPSSTSAGAYRCFRCRRCG